MTLVGTKIPDFELDATVDGKTQPFKFSQLGNGWKVVLFYPRSFTGVCQSEVSGFSQLHDKFKGKNAHIIAISTDSPFVHQAWTKHDAKGLKIPLLADVNQRVARMFGVLADNGAALRATFIVNPEGLIVHESVNYFHVGRSSDEIYRLLCAFETGQFCDLNWKP